MTMDRRQQLMHDIRNGLAVVQLTLRSMPRSQADPETFQERHDAMTQEVQALCDMFVELGELDERARSERTG